MSFLNQPDPNWVAKPRQKIKKLAKEVHALAWHASNPHKNSFQLSTLKLSPHQLSEI